MKINMNLIVALVLFVGFISQSFGQKDLVISGGNKVSSFVCANRVAYVWGSNAGGQLGVTGAPNPSTSPQQVFIPGSKDIQQINSGSGSHFVAVDCDGWVWAWGGNADGQVGNGTTGGVVSTPTRVRANPAVDATHRDASGFLINADVVYSGTSNTFAILDNGELVSWGKNDFTGGDYCAGCQQGMLGQGTSVSTNTANYVLTAAGTRLTGVTQIFAGDNVAYALVDIDGDGVGTVYSWGQGENGTLGRNAAGTGNPAAVAQVQSSYARPVYYDSPDVPMDNIVELQAGDVFGIALDVNGYVWTWGNGAWNNATGNTTINYAGSDPRRVIAGNTIGASNDGTYLLAKAIGGGQGYGMAVTVDSKPVAWGGTGTCVDGGVTGTGTTTAAIPPTYIQRAGGVVDNNVSLINRGDTWGFYGTANNDFYAWGCNDVGQLGIGNTTLQTRATQLTPPTGCDLRDPPPFVALTPKNDTIVCESTFSGLLLNSGFVPPTGLASVYQIRWYRNDGATPVKSGTATAANLSYNATQDGTYRVEVEYTGSNAGCVVYDVETAEININYYLQTFTAPTDLTYCGDSATVNVNSTSTANPVYTWYPTAGSSVALGKTVGSTSTDIDISTVGGTGTKTVYVEESSSASGAVLPVRPCVASGATNSNLSGKYVRIVVYEDIVIDSLDVIYCNSQGNAQTPQTWRASVFGTMMNNGNVVPNTTAGAIFNGVQTTVPGNAPNTCKPLRIPVKITLPGTPAGRTYFVNISQGSDYQPFDCTVSYPLTDNVPGQQIVEFTGTNEFGNPGAANKYLSPFFNMMFSTKQKFCDRIPVDLTELCPCNKPDSVNAGATITQCNGTTDISLTGGSYEDGGNPIENTMNYVWYKKGGAVGTYTPVPTPVGSVGAYDFTAGLTQADSGMWVLRVEDGNDGSVPSCYTEDSVLVRVVPIPTAPTATNPNNVCVGDVAPEWKADSLAPNKLLWYTTASGGSEAETAPLINTSTEGTRNVWVSQTTATTPSCESDRTPLSITVNPNPQNLTITPGDTAYCVGTTYNLVASADASPAVTYTWYKGATPTGTTSATQTGDATTTGSPHVYSVVADSAGCTDSVSVVVTINALPTGGISIDKDSICDDGVEVATVSMTASANGPYDFYYTASVSSPTGADAQNEGSPYTGFSTSSEETIKLDSIVDVNGCKYVGINTDVVDVDYYSDVVASVATECQDVNSSLTNTQFQIRVSVTSGDLSTIDFEQISSVSGVTFTAQGSGVWLSNPISETESIDLRVFDDNGCNGGDTIADINQLCSCPSSGTLAISESTVCPGDSTDITVSYTNTVVSNVNIRLFDDNDVQIDSAINISSSPAVFRVGTLGDYKATIEHITNSCTVNGSPSVTLAHYDSLKAVIRNDADVCANGDSTSSITVEVTGNTGQGPYSYYYSVNNALNTTPETITTGNVRSFESAVLPVGTTADQVYRLDSLEDANGCKAIAQNLTGEATISPIALPEADITETGPKIQTADPTQDLNDANVLPPDYIRLWEVRKGTPAPVTLATLSTTTGTPVTVSGLEKEKIVEVILTISDDGGVCPVAKDSILIERVDETVPNAGADTSICVGNGVTRVGNSVVDAVNESVRWYKAGAPSVNLSLNETLTVAPASLTTAGSPHVYVYETTNSISSTVRTDSFAITVIAMPVAVISGYADGATITTNTLPVVLQQGAALPPDYTGAWFYENTVTIPTGGNGVGTPTNPTSISVDGLEFEESGEVTYTVSDVGGVCPDSSVTITVERKNITAACAINDTVCVSALAAGGIYSQSPCSLPVGAEQAEWLQVSGSPNPTSNADNSMSVTLAGVGTYQFTYRIFNPTIMGGSGTPIESKKTITIKVIDVPVVSSATLTGDSFGCQDTVKTYTATGILNAESYAWTLPTGFTFEGGTPSTSTTAKVVLGGTTGGDITIRATNRCGFKDTLIDVSTIYLKPTGGTVASNVSYCPSDDSVYTFRLTTAPTSVLPLTYLWDIDGGDLEGANLTSDTVQVSFENKTGPQTISLVPKNACGEPKTVSDLPNTVTATQTPAISASVDLESSLADDVTYCIDDTDDITFTATASNAGATPTYTFYQGLVEIQASSTTNTVAVPKSTIADQDVIRVEMVGTPGVCYTSSSGEDKLIMDGYKIPVVTISSDFTEICEQGTPGRIGIKATVTPETSKGVNEMTIFRGASTAKFELTTLPVTMNQLTYSATQPSHTGTYTATAKNEVCPESDVSAPIDVKIWEQPNILGFVVDNDPPAPADTVAGGLVRRFMNKGTTKDIGIGGWIETKQENGNYTYLWNTDDAANKDVITNASSNPTIIRLDEQLNDDIILEITNGLCSTEREFLLQVLYPLFVPNAFSPNGDGSNDFWEISGLADFPQATVSVFNRWGNRVFEETKNYTNTNAWTGEKSPVGTYYYIIKLNREGYPEALTGSVTITR